MAKSKKKTDKDSKSTKDNKYNLNDGKISTEISSFTLSNGDKYNGYYITYSNDLIFRQDHGEYITKDGQIYEADWHFDNINESKNVKISYNDGSIYEGPLVSYKYQGQGEYTCVDSSIIACNFVANIPVGEITLKDPNKMLWKGTETLGHVLLFPENNFYNEIPDTLGLYSFIDNIMKPNKYDVLCNMSYESLISGSNELASYEVCESE